MDKNRILALILLILSFAASFFAYPYLPDKIAIHWNMEGNADGFSGKAFGLFLVPIISIFFYMLLLLMPKIDPLKKNIDKFSGYYYGFINIFLAFMLYLHIITIAQNSGFAFNMAYALIPAMAVLFFIVGMVLEKAKMNWTMGIRTPWTMSSENVWNKTHKLGAKCFKAAAVASLAGLAFPKYAFFVFMAALILAGLVPVVYSYVEFAREKKAGKKRQ